MKEPKMDVWWQKQGEAKLARLVSVYTQTLRSASETLAHRGSRRKRPSVGGRTVEKAEEMLREIGVKDRLEKRIAELESKLARTPADPGA